MTTRLPPGVKLGKDSEEGEILSDSPAAHSGEISDLTQTSGIADLESAGQTRRDDARKR